MDIKINGIVMIKQNDVCVFKPEELQGADHAWCWQNINELLKQFNGRNIEMNIKVGD